MSVMALLPKKGDLTPVRNYRPIQLVNTDTMMFTRLLNQRLMANASHLINQYHIGFLPGRFIAEHGLLTQMIMEDACYNPEEFPTAIGMLLDQEKAYDRVNLSYLEAGSCRLGAPLFSPPLYALCFETTRSQSIEWLDIL